MQATGTTTRQYRTKSKKLQILNELNAGDMTISILAFTPLKTGERNLFAQR